MLAFLAAIASSACLFFAEGRDVDELPSLSELELSSLLLEELSSLLLDELLLDELLLDLSKSRTHIAIVSERSDILGIITVEDILEELVGEIFDEYDPEANDFNDSVKEGAKVQ